MNLRGYRQVEKFMREHGFNKVEMQNGHTFIVKYYTPEERLERGSGSNRSESHLITYTCFNKLESKGIIVRDDEAIAKENPYEDGHTLHWKFAEVKK